MSNITKKEVEKMLDNHSKSIELSNAKEELSKVNAENKQLISELSSEDVTETVEKTEEVDSDDIEKIQEKIEEVVSDGAEANGGELTDLGAVLEKVSGLEGQVSSLVEVVEEMSSKFKDICSSIQYVSPMASGIGQMTTSSEEFVVVDEDGKILSKNEKDEVEFLDTVDEKDGGLSKACKFSESEAKKVAEDKKGQVLSVKDAFKFVEKSSEEDVATDEEVETAIEVLEKFVDKFGTLEEVKEKTEEVKDEVTEEMSKKKEISSLRERIRKRKPETSSKREGFIEGLREKYSVETSSKNEDSCEYQAGELAGKLFARKR